MSSTEGLINNAIENVVKDRDAAEELLKDVARHIGKSSERYERVGMVAAKYLEVMQRSNEQLVKLIAIQQKQAKAAEVDEEITKEDVEEFYQDVESDEYDDA